MWNMQLCMAHLLVVSDCRYLQNWASGGAKTSFSDQKWLYFQSRLLSFKHIEYWKPPKHAPCKTAYFTFQALNNLINIGGLNGVNCLGKTQTKLASSRFSWNRSSRNGLNMEPLPTLVGFWSHMLMNYRNWLTSSSNCSVEFKCIFTCLIGTTVICIWLFDSQWTWSNDLISV